MGRGLFYLSHQLHPHRITMSQVPIIEAEHFFPCQTLLGEGEASSTGAPSRSLLTS